MKKCIGSILFLSFALSVQAQFTKQDTLRGSITPERAWWDLQQYDLKVEVFPEARSIQGVNTITYTVLESKEVMQIDLQNPMKIEKVTQKGKELSFTSEGSAHFINLKEKQKKGATNTLTIQFSGTPKVARNPPWDGGFTWRKDSQGNHFIANSNQGIGSSIWWPNKDHPADEPDKGVHLEITVPSNLVAVGNGRLINTQDKGDKKTWTWRVVNPINNYAINVNIGDYVHFSEKYKGEKGELDMDYWVLLENEAKAKAQFKQAPMMMEAFEHWFGPYPFYEDSFKLVEVPYLGMEHQSSVTYGNGYANGYLGNDLSGSGWGLKFDFIIIHEAGHEWFANNITNKDVADMWIHEGFTAYSENLYLDYHFGKEASSEYVVGTRKIIRNDRPVIGTYNVSHSGSSDMYYKGANILHTLRQLLEDDEKWRSILRGLNTVFYHQTVTSQQVEEYISKQSGIDLTEFWQQYLRTTMIPKVEYKIIENTLSFRYTNIIEKFDMPVIMVINGKEEWIFPTSEWKSKEFKSTIESATIKPDFYVESEVLKN
ncbi:M1 family metallopeptidase [Aureisphaera sp. CAU 1614]|uniref:M1 family metallopeptidase n=1 Tax=Halomarinibacterium sedimenti TaxID=2857106 RepID=A0A9X1FQD5_9FLAO|nr:M1 family metallopeptidase [Halomarinibacterium sedimenti]MBW2938159.1 M1 family metallopeptidase [Halomarinibacterium sedimenti]